MVDLQYVGLATKNEQSIPFEREWWCEVRVDGLGEETTLELGI